MSLCQQPKITEIESDWDNQVIREREKGENKAWSNHSTEIEHWRWTEETSLYSAGDRSI